MYTCLACRVESRSLQLKVDRCVSRYAAAAAAAAAATKACNAPCMRLFCWIVCAFLAPPLFAQETLGTSFALMFLLHIFFLVMEVDVHVCFEI